MNKGAASVQPKRFPGIATKREEYYILTRLTRMPEVMMDTNTWKLQDAKARFSEVVRRARSGKPQQITVHGRQAVILVDPERFEIRPKPPNDQTLAGFIERSKKYRGAAPPLQRFKVKFPSKHASPFDEGEQ